MAPQLQMWALADFPLVQPGDNLAAQIIASLQASALALEPGDILVIAQKIVSKAENRYVSLDRVEAGEQAQALAQKTDKDPRLVQLILDESVAVLRHRPGVIVVEHRLGYVHANAGIDRSNIGGAGDDPTDNPLANAIDDNKGSDASGQRVLLLPEDPDASAAALRRELQRHSGAELAVIINDSAGRAWRNGTLGFAIGSAGLQPLVDLAGKKDLFGRPLEITQVAVADELAAGASFLMGQAGEGRPVVLVRGAALPAVETGSAALIRAREQDLFR